MMDSSAIDDAIVSADTYARPERYDALFETLRRDDPLHWTAPSGHRPFWTVSKYEDIQSVEGDPALFINAPRLILRPIVVEERIRALTGGRSLLLRNLVNIDGDEHQAYRMLTQAWFMPPRLRTLEDDLRGLARQHMEILTERGGACDFVRDVASWYPLRVIMSILGLPSSDEAKMLKLTQDVFGPDDPDVKTDPNVNVVSTVDEYRSYFGALTAVRRAEPTDDLASLIANARFNGSLIGDLEALSYYIIVATAGHDTTSSTTAGGLLALIQNQDQMRLLRDNPALLPGAIDEMLRWVTPVKHFFRTATADTELRGARIRKGDGLMLAYASANRDSDIFAEPFTFDIRRSPNRHIAFGYGPHVCLGQHLAKMEIRIFFEELLKRFDSFELDGEPAWLASNFVSGLKRMPIRYRTI